MDKMQKKIAPTEQDKKLDKWRSKLETSRLAYADTLAEIKQNEMLYEGTRKVLNADGHGYAPKEAINIRNICYELVESQVDSSIPMPKVTALHEEDELIAKKIEKALQNKIKEQRFGVMNDLMERIVPVQGGDFFQIEWDNSLGRHNSVGDVTVSERHPRQVIPQAGVTEIEKMDYIFVLYPQTKEFVKKKYGVDVSEASEDYKEIRGDGDNGNANDIVTINMVYYRGEEGIGRFTWCDDYVLEDLEDYQARRTRKCTECDTPTEEDVCPVCGGKKFHTTKDTTQLVDLPYMAIQIVEGMEIPIPTTKTVEIENYVPNEIPIILRRNVTKINSFLGYSDVKVIRDQQEMIKKLGSKAAEKTLKGGSIVTLPDDVKVETTDKELKVVVIDNPSQKALIDVINIQPDISQDLNMMALEYEFARSTLGITDSYQGKYDASATSGTAKQYAINQAAGRLESKKTLKQYAFSRVYELMFKFWLAYSDDPMNVISQDADGEMVFEVLDKSEFVKQDADGKYYWNDEFIFETDPTSTLLANREAMWNQADMMLQSGAFGVLGDLDTMLLYWTFKEKNGYPNAGEVKRAIEERKQKQEQDALLMQQQAEMLQEQQPQQEALGTMGGLETPQIGGDLGGM